MTDDHLDDLLRSATWDADALSRLDDVDAAALREGILAMDRTPRTDDATTAVGPFATETAHPAAVHPIDAARRRRRRVLVATAIGAATLAAGAGAAVAINALTSPDSVERGMPGSSAIFLGTEPSCTTQDNVVFHCRLKTPPTEEVMDHYAGAVETFNDDAQRIAGGCRADSDDGLEWTCYAGERAVQENLISADFLGEQTYGPARG